MDASDEANEGEWIFTSSTETEQPYITNTNMVDSTKNCLMITSATALEHIPCDSTTSRAIVCESEGNRITLNPCLRSPCLNATPLYMPRNGLSRSSTKDAYVLYPPPRDAHWMPPFQSDLHCMPSNTIQAIKSHSWLHLSWIEHKYPLCLSRLLTTNFF